MISRTFTGTVSAKFITRRDKKINEHRVKGDIENLVNRWNAEFPEHHQCMIDPDQTLFEGNEKYSHHEFDVIHKIYGNCDYKQFAIAGVRVSNYIMERIKNGTINHVIVWEWSNGNISPVLIENQEVSYTILGVVPASYIIETAEVAGQDKYGKNYYRFPYVKGETYV
jgi:hypothetical protein